MDMIMRVLLKYDKPVLCLRKQGADMSFGTDKRGQDQIGSTCYTVVCVGLLIVYSGSSAPKSLCTFLRVCSMPSWDRLINLRKVCSKYSRARNSALLYYYTVVVSTLSQQTAHDVHVLAYQLQQVASVEVCLEACRAESFVIGNITCYVKLHCMCF